MSNRQKKFGQSIRKLLMSNKIASFPARMGNLTGTVKADENHNVYVTLPGSGEVLTVYNPSLPNVPRMWVVVGKASPEDTTLQVLKRRNVQVVPQFVDIVNHAKNHTWPGVDTVAVRGEQYLPGLIVPDAGIAVRLFGVVYYLNGWHVAFDQVIDLSGSVPASGALMVLIEIDDAGVVTLNEGGAVDSREELKYEDIPTPSASKAPLGAVKLYAGQASVLREELSSDILDLRMSGYATFDIAATIHAAPADTAPEDTDEFGFWDSVTEVLNKITWANIKAMLNTYFDGIYQAALGYTAENSANKTDVMAGNTASSTKYLSAKGVYDWAIATFQAALGYTAENSANKTDAMAGNTASSTKYLSAKGVYDWAVATFQALNTALTQIAGLTPSNDDILQRKSGAWTNRTIAQLITDLTSGLSALFAPVATPSFEVYQVSGSPTSVNNTTNTAVICTGENIDTGNYHNTTTGKFTPLVAGTYEFHGATFMLNMADGKSVWVGFRKNGSIVRWHSITNISATNNEGGGMAVQRFYLNGVDDYVEMIVWHDHGSARDTYNSGSNVTHWGGHRISASDICGL